jgi:hypothetical protein
MTKAAINPNPVLVSDWTHVKSWNYMEAEEASGYTILYLLPKFQNTSRELTIDAAVWIVF